MERLVLSALLLTAVESYSSGGCTTTEQCQDTTRVCLSGYVEWKWECQPEVGLGEDCITSAQCTTTNSQFCNPINHKCSCERGFSPMVSNNYGLHCQRVATKSEDVAGYNNGYITQILWSPDTLNLSSVSRQDQAGTVTGGVRWVLCSLVVVGGLAAALLTLLYVKTLQEKRASQERVKSLLRLVAEQSEMRPSLTSLTSFTTSLDLEDLYSSYSTARDSRDSREQTSSGFVDFGKKGEIDKDFRELQLPPSYDELLK